MIHFRLARIAFFAAVLTFAGGAKLYAEESPLQEHALGKKDAPVVMEEYASLTCSHCADFTAKTLPELEKKYIEVGKLRYVFHPFPTDGVALKASVLAKCMPTEQYYPFISVLFKNLREWALSKSPEATIIQYAKLGGLPEEKAKACLEDTKIMDALVEERTRAERKYDIDSTPTFIFNRGEEKIVGAMKLDQYVEVIERLLKEKK